MSRENNAKPGQRSAASSTPDQAHKGDPKCKSEAAKLRAELARLQEQNASLTSQLAKARKSEEVTLLFIETKELYAKL